MDPVDRNSWKSPFGQNSHLLSPFSTEGCWICFPPTLPGVIAKWIHASKLPSLPRFPPTVDSVASRWGISGKLWKGFNPHSLSWDFCCWNFSSSPKSSLCSPLGNPSLHPKFLGNSAFPRCCCDFPTVSMRASRIHIPAGIHIQAMSPFLSGITGA